MGIREAGERLVEFARSISSANVQADETFKALQEINVCEKLIASATKTIKECEEELTTLSELRNTESNWNPFGSSGISTRLSNLLNELEEAEEKRMKLDSQLNKLKKALKK
jgi:chromosome segregation ATPase